MKDNKENGFIISQDPNQTIVFSDGKSKGKQEEVLVQKNENGDFEINITKQELINGKEDDGILYSVFIQGDHYIAKVTDINGNSFEEGWCRAGYLPVCRMDVVDCNIANDKLDRLINNIRQNNSKE